MNHAYMETCFHYKYKAFYCLYLVQQDSGEEDLNVTTFGMFDTCLIWSIWCDYLLHVSVS